MMEKISYESRVYESVDDKRMSWDIFQKKNFERISYERRVYESVDDKRMPLGYISKIDEKKNYAAKGSNLLIIILQHSLKKFYILFIVLFFRFDILVNGGGAVTLMFQRANFEAKTVTVPLIWNDIVVLDPIVLMLKNQATDMEKHSSESLEKQKCYLFPLVDLIS